MSDLFFMRHGARADHVPGSVPLHTPYKNYDPLVVATVAQDAARVARQLVERADFGGPRKNVFVHFLPYLRCCESADLLVLAVVAAVQARHPATALKVQLLGDFALLEWVHDKMAHKPPFFDSTEAYQMYTPNIQTMENRRLVLNFRPTTKLGPWNEPDILFKDFQDRCRRYLERLIATYDTPSHKDDVVVVVSHGYVISTILLHFINHPIFEEIPEFGLNHATHKDGVWRLVHDCLGVLARDPLLDTALGLDSDIVYYKTNFVKKTDANDDKQFPAMGFSNLAKNTLPRPSFRILSLGTSHASSRSDNPLCPGARDWDPVTANKYAVQSEFRLKVINDEAFKRAFDLSNRPAHPISPDISPTSEPSRINSTVDLAKLASNDEIYRPLKLRYSLASDIPVLHLNSKVNSHVSLAQLQRANSNTSLGPVHAVGSGLALPADFDHLPPNMAEFITSLARVRSLQRRRAQSTTPKFNAISEQEQEQDERDHESSGRESGKETEGSGRDSDGAARPPFSLQFTPNTPAPAARQPSRPRRSLSLRFVPTLEETQKRLIFFDPDPDSSLDSGSDSDSGSSVDTLAKYVWFGHNMKQ